MATEEKRSGPPPRWLAKLRAWAAALAAVIVVVGAPPGAGQARAVGVAPAAQNSPLGLGGNSAPIHVGLEAIQALKTHQENAERAGEQTSDDSYATRGGMQLGTAGDAFLANAAKAAPVEGALDVAVHGSPLAVEIGENTVSHRVLARLIQESPEFAGQEIRLLSCSTGACPTGFAQNLANKLGVPVSAPNDIIC